MSTVIEQLDLGSVESNVYLTVNIRKLHYDVYIPIINSTVIHKIRVVKQRLKKRRVMKNRTK